MSAYPLVNLKAAMSLDGYIDDASDTRLVLSCEEDRQAVDALRAQVDAILIGAETLRRDDPRLLVRDPALIEKRTQQRRPLQPLRVVITKSAKLPGDARLFQEPYPVLIVAPPEMKRPSALPSHVEWLACSLRAPDEMTSLFEILGRRNIAHVLVEGGAQVLRQCINERAFHAFRLAIAPVIVGAGGTRLFSFDDKEMGPQKMALHQQEGFGHMTVLHLLPTKP